MLSLALLVLAAAGCDSTTDAPPLALADVKAEATAQRGGNGDDRAAIVGCNSGLSTTVVRNEAGVLVAYTGPTSSSNCVYNSQNGLAQFTVLLPEELTPDRTERLEAPEDFPFCTSVDPRTKEELTTTRAFIINRPSGESKVVCHF